MLTRFSELIGFLLGYPVGLFFALGSLFRHARFFHPRGLLFCGEVETLPESPFPLPTHAMIRFSSAWWKHFEWPDVLGVSIRMSDRRVRSVVPYRNDQDLLFASFGHPWEMFLAPFFTEYKDFLANSYYAVSPFRSRNGELFDLMLEPSKGTRSQGDRSEKLFGEVMSGKVVLRLLMKEKNKNAWTMVGKIRLLDELHLDQEALRFHPFQSSGEFRPAGFLHYLRFGTYHLSQWARPAESPEARGVVSE